MVEKVLAVLDQDLPKSIDKLFALLRYKSISTDPNYKSECRAAADWLVAELKTIGFEASRRDTAGHPMVVAHHEGPNEDCPHVLFYGHYDVQPVDPISLWQHDPFEPIITNREGIEVISARGSADDKGQLLTFIEACRAFKTVYGQLPLRVSILFEGEEESGSPSLIPFLKANAPELTADYALVCDTNMWDAETPAITVGLRGLLAQEIVVEAANRDLHSGMFGGIAANPITVLAKIIAALHDSNNRITLPHFYDNVQREPQEIISAWAQLRPNAQSILTPVGLEHAYGEKGFYPLELIWSRPTAELNGISGGYVGEGFKTVIPSQAQAKLSFRLVEGQDPEKIKRSLQEFVRERIPQDCSVSFIDHGASPAIKVDHNSPFVSKAKEALSKEWGKEAVLIASGGSIPVVGDFASILNVPSLLIGFGLDDDNIHSPNEKYNMSSFHKGQRSWARILNALAQ